MNLKIRLKELYKDQNEKVAPNLLIIEINPNENVSLQLNSRNPLNGEIEPVKISFSTEQEDVPEAYERLIYDAFRGDSTFFAHWKEVELSWEWVQPILDAFNEDLCATSHIMSPDPTVQRQLINYYKRWIQMVVG